MTFDLHLVLVGVWHGVKGEAMADQCNCAESRTRGKAMSRCGCEEVVLLRSYRKLGKLLCGQCGETVVKKCAFWPCGSCVVFVG